MSKPDYFKLVTGQTFNEFTKLPSLEQSLKSRIKTLSSKYPLRLLGEGEKEIWITEEEREVNFHILGAPGEGKSKFLEHNIRKDIDLGNGLCLLDPSEGGDTVNNVLAYCAKIGYEKVIFIDPSTISRFDKTPCIAPLTSQYVEKSSDGVMEALNILFEVKATATPRIKRYLSALLRILARKNLTLAETLYFSDYAQDIDVRRQILGDDRDSLTIKSLFRSDYKFDTFFSSSVNKLDALWREPLTSMLAHTEGIDFTKAVSKGWVILVNLSPYRLTHEQARLLGIIVLSQIVQAVDILVNNGWKGVYYLYMDEAGRFATPQIDQLLSYKRKSGLRLVLAHHYFEQFEDKKILNSIMNNARIKMMFDTPSYDDRMMMIKALGYGGDIPPVLANYANQNIPKQYAIIRKNKETPVRIRIPDVKPYPKADDEYLQKILSHPFYKSSKQIKDEINARVIPTYSKRPQSGKASDDSPISGADVPRRRTSSLSESSKKPPISKTEKPLKI